MQGYRLDVRVVDSQLTVTAPGVPPGFEATLEPTASPDTFVLRRGPLDGLAVRFQVGDDATPLALSIGDEFELSYSPTPPPEPEFPTGRGLTLPPLTLDDEKTARFDVLMAEVLRGTGQQLSYELPYPKHEFLQYLAWQDRFIFHGSAKADIEQFLTRRTSIELNDRSGRGNVQGIYGTHDGIWPLFFAVVNRDKISGSIRNGVQYFQNEAGEETAVYHFSINQDWLDKAPWRDGTLYVLPRDTFRRMPMTRAGGLSNEWVSEQPVKPLVRIPIAPQDFPFLDQIGGHDDSELTQLHELGQKITQATTEADISDAVIKSRLDFSAELGETLMAYIPLAQKYIPAARYVLRFEPEAAVWLDMSGPPAVMQVARDRIEKHLSQTASAAATDS